MSIAESIAPHLAYLRRFARNLTGRQDTADAWVAATIEALIDDPSRFQLDLDARAALYKSFLAVWQPAAASRPSAVNGDDAKVTGHSRRLTSITPIARQAFLLTAVEGFSAAEAAQILGRSTAQIAIDLEDAGREIAEQIATRILIIEDEPLIALDLEGAVTPLGHEVLGVARTRRQAIEQFYELQPGLILADVQLADGSSGLDAVNDILLSTQLPVIFITAYPEKLLTGLMPEPTFLISKPFQHELVQAVISQVLFFDVKAGRRAVM